MSRRIEDVLVDLDDRSSMVCAEAAEIIRRLIAQRDDMREWREAVLDQAAILPVASGTPAQYVKAVIDAHVTMATDRSLAGPGVINPVMWGVVATDSFGRKVHLQEYASNSRDGVLEKVKAEATVSLRGPDAVRDHLYDLKWEVVELTVAVKHPVQAQDKSTG